MQRIGSLLRNNNFLSLTTVRGPKKKKETQLKIQSNDIVNIFKERQDPQPNHLQQYPLYVQQLARPPLTCYDFMHGAQIQLPHMTPVKVTHKTFLRGLKRQAYKGIRQYKQLDSIPINKSQKFQYHQRMVLPHMFEKSAQEQQADEAARREEEANSPDEY